MPINPRYEPEGGFYRAQICRNGHVVSPWIDYAPETGSPFCPQCGIATLEACETCGTSIRGYRDGDFLERNWSPAAFCHNCGSPYAWTAARQAAAQELIELEEGLSDSDKAALIKDLADLAQDSPRTEVAVKRARIVLAKLPAASGRALRDVLVGIATEVAKRGLMGPG